MIIPKVSPTTRFGRADPNSDQVVDLFRPPIFHDHCEHCVPVIEEMLTLGVVVLRQVPQLIIKALTFNSCFVPSKASFQRLRRSSSSCFFFHFQMCVCVCMRIYMCMCRCVSVYLCICESVCMFICVFCVFVYMYMCICVFVYVYMCVFVCKYGFLGVYVCVYVNVYVCVCMCMCMCMCMSVSVSTSTSTSVSLSTCTCVNLSSECLPPTSGARRIQAHTWHDRNPTRLSQQPGQAS